MDALIIFIILVVCIAAVLVLGAMAYLREDFEAAGVVLGPMLGPGGEIGSVPGDDVVVCCCGDGTHTAPLLVCTVCQRVRTRPGHWVAGGCAPFGGAAAIRAAGKAEDCVCPWCAGMVAAKLKDEVRTPAGAMS